MNKKNVLIGGTIAVLALGWIGSATSNGEENKKKPEVAQAVTITAPTTEAPSTTEAPPSTAHVATEAELNMTWAAQALEDSYALVDGFDAVSTAAGNYDLGATVSACEDLKGPAAAFGDHAPDTEAGRHAQKASTLYLAAAQACSDGDLEGAIPLMAAGGEEMDLATAALG